MYNELSFFHFLTDLSSNVYCCLYTCLSDHIYTSFHVSTWHRSLGSNIHKQKQLLTKLIKNNPTFIVSYKSSFQSVAHGTGTMCRVGRPRKTNIWNLWRDRGVTDRQFLLQHAKLFVTTTLTN